MSSAQDPFYIVKEEIQESIDTLLSTFHGWESLSDTREQEHLSKELLASCESIEWQVDELDKTIAVAAREPAFYGIGEVELGKRQKWTRIAHDQVNMVRKAVSAGKGQSFQDTASVNGMHRELMRLQVGHTPEMAGSNQYAHENDDILSSESDWQLLLIKQQDEELDELSASVQRIGHVGLTIHDELHGQERILDELGREMDSTSNRLDFLQCSRFASGAPKARKPTCVCLRIARASLEHNYQNGPCWTELENQATREHPPEACPSVSRFIKVCTS